MLKKKKIPTWLKNRFLIRFYQSKFGVLFSNWLAQCMLYAEPTEVIFRLSLELFIFLFFVAIYGNFARIDLYSFLTIGVLTHTVTFFINGQFFVMMRFLRIAHNNPKLFIEYPEVIRARLVKRKSICAVIIFGSLSREEFSSSSDLDVRVVAEDGFMSNYIACFWIFIERFHALFNKYPLDVYVITKHSGFEQLRTDEPPVTLFDKVCFVSEHFNEYYDFDLMRMRFLEKDQ